MNDDWIIGTLAAQDRYQPPDDPWSQNQQPEAPPTTRITVRPISDQKYALPEPPGGDKMVLGSDPDPRSWDFVPSQSEARTFQGTPTENLSYDIGRGLETLGVPSHRAYEVARGVKEGLGFIPGIGSGIGLGEAKDAFARGNYGTAALNTAMAVPVVPAAMAGAVKAGAKKVKQVAMGELAALDKLPTLRRETSPTMGTLLADQPGTGYNVPHETALRPAIAEAPLDVPGRLGGASGGAESLRQAHLQAERRAAGVRPLPGLPRPETPLEVGGNPFVPGPVGAAHEVAAAYMADKNFGVAHPSRFHPLDIEHARAIAKAYDELPMFDPAALPSYEAMARETLAQYQAIRKAGLKLTPVDAATYPYGRNPRAVARDVADNNHMAFFRTDQGFGTGNDAAHPLLQKSGEKIGDHELLYNDLFRIVHDYMGHVKNGYGFRAGGEDNAWRAHAAMYSDLARRAMTTETRGQNSWLNHGPYGETNRTANTVDTVFAPQKVALLPHWVTRDLEGTMPVFQRPNPIERYATDPQRSAYPGIYKDPRVIAQEAAANVAPEHPALKELFGVTRDDLYEMGGRGTRQGNVDPKIWMPGKSTSGSYSANAIMNPANAQRQIDALTEGLKYPDLAKGMLSWYVMDPAFRRMEQLVGREQAIKDYTRLNATTAPFSAGSNVNTEINRGTAANMMAARGEFPKFQRHAGTAEEERGPRFPKLLRDVIAHPYHGVQSDPVARWLKTGEHGYDKNAQKIFLYHLASGVPETGFQTRLPILDAHLARSSGAADVRTMEEFAENMKGAEYRDYAPYYRENIAKPMGFEAVPTQGFQWGTFAPQTGVETAIGAPKLELLAQRIWERAKKLGIDPKKLRDDVLTGKAHATWLLGGAVPASMMMGGLAAQDKYETQ